MQQVSLGVSKVVVPYGFGEGDYSLSSGDELDDAPKAPVRAKWDCATIVSTYTNTENHPQLVDDDDDGAKRKKKQPAVIKLSAKTGLPLGVLDAVADSDGDDEEGDSGEEDDAAGVGSAAPVAPRAKGETAEERKARKQAVKEARRVSA